MNEIDWPAYSFDDQDLTAFAVGAAEHLEDETRAAIEAALKADEALRDEFAAIQTTATTIEAALGAVAGEAPALGMAAREAVIEAATDGEVVAGAARPIVAMDDRRARRSGIDRLVRPFAWLLDGSALQVASKLVGAGLAMWLVGLPVLRWTSAWALYTAVDNEIGAASVAWLAERADGSELESLDARNTIDKESLLAALEPPSLTDLVLRRADTGLGDLALGSAESGAIMEAEGEWDASALDIALTPTALALTIRSTAPPPPPGTGGASPASVGADEAAESFDVSRRLAVDVSRYSALDDRETVGPRFPSDAPGLPPDFNTEAYAEVEDNRFQSATDEPLSTFSIDVDTASYSNIRRFIQQMGQLPPPSAVRIEEMINYFDYDYSPPAPNSETPFAVHVEIADAPWMPEHRLVRIGLKGREIERDARPDSNLVFLIDVSGSMAEPNKLPLVQRSLGMLVEQLGSRDRVGIVTYAGNSGVALRSTPGDDSRAIMRVVDALGAGGSTAGAAGIESAYELASNGFIEGGVNRVILLTDGDFNVGVTSHDELQRIIEDQAKRGIFLSVLGFGMGNYKDDTLELLADKGNGNYGYIDTEAEARKLFVEQMSGTLVTIAKDVKIQVEFNPAGVEAYRLIGYENRMLAARDFNDDTKDAGEIGAGHTVTALYEVVPTGVAYDLPEIDPLRYGEGGADDEGVTGENRSGDDLLGDIDALSSNGPGELLFVKLRHKAPDSDVSTRVEFPVFDEGRSLRAASDDFHFAAAVAAFGMLLRESPHAGDATFEDVLQLARAGDGDDENGYRAELIDLIRRAGDIARR